jgi:hypothetical protein
MPRKIAFTGVPEARQEGDLVAFSADVDPQELLEESRGTMWSKRPDGWYVTEARLLSHDPDGETVIEITTDTDITKLS